MKDWQPFKLAHKPAPSIKWLKKHFDIDKARAKQFIEQCQAAVVYLNNIYEVEKRLIRANDESNWPSMYWLSIKRIDKQPIHDWRDLQRIKNELVGEENEAVELYPAESRLIDACNQFHLWVIADSNLQFPFGFKEGRAVSGPEQAIKTGGRQRAFE